MGLALCICGTLGKGTLRTYPSFRVPTHVSSWLHRKYFFSQAVRLNHLHRNNDHHTSILQHIPFFIKTNTEHIIMTDRLPLAELSIQNKILPPAETTQPIKTKKVHS